MNLKISVITPSFNQAQFLPDNLRSVSTQTYSEVEHIVVDPGSTDGSTKLASEKEGVTLIAEPDRGQSDGITKGFMRSTGDILTWLNSDDYYPDDQVLTKVAAAFESHPDADIIYGNVDFVDENGKFLRKGFVNPNSDQLLESFSYQVGIVQPGVFMRRSVLDKLGGPSDQYEYCMDYEYWVRMAAAGLKWKFINTKLANHRWWSGMKTSSGRDKSLIEHMRVNAEYFGYIHWKWIDRYAEYLSTGKDGVVNHLVASSPVERSVNAQRTIHRFVTQDMMRTLSERSSLERLATKEYIERYAPEFKRYYARPQELEIASETNPDPDAEKHIAWRIMSAETRDRVRYNAYHVPNNFSRYFETNWYDAAIRRSQQRLIELSRFRRDVCVIVGNGPSLQKTNLDLLKNADVIISNFATMHPQLAECASILTVTNDLVATQGAVDFNATKTAKVFPFWLANSINETSETAFVPATVEPIFNTELNGIFSWRSTVSYFNMQLAYALGYRKVLLVGFDHSYAQPRGMKEGDLIEQMKDDENHFDPRYFKGKTWQAADTTNMEKMYQLAKTAYEADGRDILNCTEGGKLEVFRRESLENQLANFSGIKTERPIQMQIAAPQTTRISTPKPRVLLIDMTKVGDATATGELKATLFADWPESAFMQIYNVKGGKFGVFSGGDEQFFANKDKEVALNIEKLVKQFDPQVVLYRPTPETEALHRAAMILIYRLQKPLVTWVMDDWPTAFAAKDPAAAATMERDWRSLLNRSAVRLSISNAMSKAFKSRYDLDFVAVANGIDPDDWPEPTHGDDNDLTVRYAGSLAENMTLSSIRTVAQAVERLADGGIDIKFEIKTRELWRQRAEPLFKDFKNTKFFVADLQPTEYRSWLADADITVIAYNFDDVSKSYVQYSLANKLPECLASGAPLLAVGPRDVATMATLENYDIGVRVTNNSVDDVAEALKRLSASPDQRHTLGAKARDVALQHFNVVDVRKKLAHALYVASRQTVRKTDAPEKSREDGARVDETAVVAHILSGQRGRDHTMLDVGAHFGSSAAYFHELDWTIHCFEPDPANRKKLEARWGASTNISIDPRAVSDRPATGASFFSSVESTGISSLGAFRDTHKESARVDITTVGEIVEVHQIKHIDFLKIDVEGFDLSVLKGVPWDQLKPDVIECEFEDAKTVPMGHTWQDIADFLVVQGYKVYISEWHPIVRYGIPHDWRRVVLYNPAVGIAPDAWGNLLAFKNDPGLHAVQSAFDAKMQVRTKRAPSSVQPQQTKPTDSTAESASVRPSAAPIGPRPFYAHAAERLQKRSPLIYTVARLVLRGLAAMWRRRLIVAPFALFIAFTFFTGLAQPELERKLLFSGGAAMLGISIVVLYLGWWTYHRIRVLTLEMSALRRALEKERKNNSDVAAKQ